MTQNDLADILHTDRWTVADIENGKTDKLTFEQLNAICDFFPCDADYLLCRIDKKTKEATDICQETGLSESAVNTLQALAADPDIYGKQIINCINLLLRAVDLDHPQESILYDIYGYICSDFALVNDPFAPDLEGLQVRSTAPDGTSAVWDLDPIKQKLFRMMYQENLLEKLNNIANKKRNL